jgi:hypothetical protein
LANGRFFGNNQVKEIFIAMWGYKEAKMQIQGYPLLLFQYPAEVWKISTILSTDKHQLLHQLIQSALWLKQQKGITLYLHLSFFIASHCDKISLTWLLPKKTRSFAKISFTQVFGKGDKFMLR